MLRILLISDTHGDLDGINELAHRTHAHLVVHAGDFGFYEADSVHRLSHRELWLLIVHSSKIEKQNISKQASREELVEIVLDNALLGDFPLYLSHERRFDVPVYAVWGNHEDIAVIEKLRNKNTVENLFILDEHHFYPIKDDHRTAFNLFGIGGNFLPGRKLFDPPLSGRGGKVWSTLHQYGELYQHLQDKEQPSLFVSHVSPGKEPLLTRIITHFKPNFWISGHMGSPYTAVWNQFAVREMRDAQEWLSASEFLKDFKDVPLLTDEAKIAFDLINSPLPDHEVWFKQIWNVNLTDAKNGYALLIVEDGQFCLETFSSPATYLNSLHRFF